MNSLNTERDKSAVRVERFSRLEFQPRFEYEEKEALITYAIHPSF